MDIIKLAGVFRTLGMSVSIIDESLIISVETNQENELIRAILKYLNISDKNIEYIYSEKYYAECGYETDHSMYNDQVSSIVIRDDAFV